MFFTSCMVRVLPPGLLLGPGEVLPHGAEKGAGRHAAVLVEAMVFGGDEGVEKVGRHLVFGHDAAVFLGAQRPDEGLEGEDNGFPRRGARAGGRLFLRFRHIAFLLRPGQMCLLLAYRFWGKRQLRVFRSVPDGLPHWTQVRWNGPEVGLHADPVMPGRIRRVGEQPRSDVGDGKAEGTVRKAGFVGERRGVAASRETPAREPRNTKAMGASTPTSRFKAALMESSAMASPFCRPVSWSPAV
ncbi:hypothetical protein JCM14719A_17370 [Calditerricola satsumensis]|uniref:Uncharacterized protein n=1 Tax=Calditerricola satsumensis TaxID=373054 RepID=A0A8J3B5Q2_9BACI|nr:hypothetical protein GCM10007043_01630 [Calditerricola satsumensis]